MDTEIYLDNNATTRPSPLVRAAMLAALDEGYGNPSSDHARGRRARDAIHNARTSLAALIGADAGQIIFTSSATEANNTILESAVARSLGGGTNRIVTTTVEHSSVLKKCEQLAQRGVGIVLAPVDADGIVELN